MSSRCSLFSRTVALALALTLGALPFASAEVRGSRQSSAIPQPVSSPTIVQSLFGSVLLFLEKAMMPGNKPGASDAKPEGSGVCPDGKPNPNSNNPKPGQS